MLATANINTNVKIAPKRNATMGEDSPNRLKDNSVDKTIFMFPNAENKCSHRKRT